MNWIPDLAAALPAPRDDEPPELRPRIIAELRDHLECAFQREFVLTGDADEAVRRVREKFGDPVQLARKLWFEALREKIMSQRLMLVCVGMLTAACMAMGIFSWKTAEQSALATQALVERLDQLVQSSDGQTSLDWVNVKLKLVTERDDEPPPAGFDVTLNDAGMKSPMSIEVRKKSPESGELDFGLLNPGRYNVLINAPWGELLSKTIYVRAGESPWTETVICPSDPEEVELQIDVNWPDDLKKKPLGLLLQLTSPARQLGGDQWRRRDSDSNYSNAKVEYCLLDTEGNVRPYSSEDRLITGYFVHPYPGGIHKAAVPRSDPVPDRRLRIQGLTQSANVCGVVLLSHQGVTTAIGFPPRQTAVYIPLQEIADGQTNTSESKEFKNNSETVNHWKLDLPDRLISEVRRKLQEIEMGSD